VILKRLANVRSKLIFKNFTAIVLIFKYYANVRNSFSHSAVYGELGGVSFCNCNIYLNKIKEESIV
jgi:hypothetical protein